MQQKYMRTIRDKANDIDRMVDKLFLFSKLDLGDCPFYPEKLDIGQELHSIVSSGSKDYSEKGLEIHCETVPEDCHVYADPVQLRSAVTNILENSLKYKDEKTVNVTIHCEDLPENLDLIIDMMGLEFRRRLCRNCSMFSIGATLQGTIQTREAGSGLQLPQKYWSTRAVLSMRKIYSRRDCVSS